MSLTKMHLNPKLTSYSPDLYSRYYYAIKTIKNIQKNNPCCILDVGGKNGLLGAFIKDQKLPYKLTVSDILADNKGAPTVCDIYRKEDFLKSTQTTTYDYVLSMDVLEHITEKDKFLKKLISAAPTIIISAPFRSNNINKIEILANNFYKTFSKINHPWLSEHFHCELPQELWLENFLSSKKLYYSKLHTNNLDNWLLFMLPSFIPSSYKIKTNFVKTINQFYNRNLDKLYNKQIDSYRTIYFISKKDIKQKLDFIEKSRSFDSTIKYRLISLILKSLFKEQISQSQYINFQQNAIGELQKSNLEKQNAIEKLQKSNLEKQNYIEESKKIKSKILALFHK